MRASVSNEQPQIILNIPIPAEPRDDELRCPFERGGKVTAKSTYHFIQSQHRSLESREEAVEDGSMQHMWTSIWKVRMLPKIKVFGWKLSAEAITVRESLSQRGVQISPICPMCDQIKTREHLILGCDWVKPVWRELLGLQAANDGCHKMEEWLVKRSSKGGRYRSNA